MPPAVKRLSAAGPLQVALAALLDGDAEIAAATGGRVFSTGTVPANVAAPWVELGESAEAAFRLFGAGGNTGDEQVTVVTRREDGKPGALGLAGHVVRVLDKATPVVAGHQVLDSTCEITTTFADPDGVHMRCVLRWRVTSWTVVP